MKLRSFSLFACLLACTRPAAPQATPATHTVSDLALQLAATLYGGEQQVSKMTFSVVALGPPDAAKGNATCTARWGRQGIAAGWPTEGKPATCSHPANRSFSWYFDENTVLSRGNVSFALVLVQTYIDHQVGPPGMDRVTAWAKGPFADRLNLDCAFDRARRYNCKLRQASSAGLTVYQMAA